MMTITPEDVDRAAREFDAYSRKEKSGEAVQLAMALAASPAADAQVVSLMNAITLLTEMGQSEQDAIAKGLLTAMSIGFKIGLFAARYEDTRTVH